MDEFLQQLSYGDSPMATPTQDRLSPLSAARREDDTSYAYLLQALTSILQQEQKRREEQRQQQQDQQGPGQLKPCESLEQGDVSPAAGLDSPSSSPRWNAASGMVSNDADRLVWEASSLLSDARPPSDFIVYNRQGDMNPPPEYEEQQQEQQQQGGQNQQQQPQPPAPPPPIFDGSVANATPPPLGGGAIGGGGNAIGGGSGTILHLACALDRPLLMAFLLCMGADARASHTAFRRLMIHEAACNGSIDCLTLLLELGHEFATKAKLVQQQQQQGSQMCVPSGRSYYESQNPHNVRRPNPSSIPYFPHGASAFGEREYRQQLSFRPPFRRGQAKDDDYYNDQRNEQDDKDEYKDKMDFLTLLRHFQRCYSNVLTGNQTELEAARSLLANAWFPDTTRLSLIRSCVFQKNDPSSSPHARSPSSSFLLHRPQGCADGHGNTPLHWAAFKNETECVGLLLEYNADANARAHPSGWTPLHDAAYSDSSDSIGLLIHKGGAQVDARANSGATPLCFAAQEDAANAARLLLEMGADLSARCAGGPSLFQPSSLGHNGQQQQPPPPPPPPPHSRFSGYTPLHYCAHYNAHSAAKVLLRHESSKKAMETSDLSDRLPIHVAVARGSSDVLRELLHAGARIDTRPKNSSRSSRSSNSSMSSGRSSRSSRSSQQRQPGHPTGLETQNGVGQGIAPAVAAVPPAAVAAAAAAPVPDFLVAAAIGRIVGGGPGTPVRRPPTPETPGGGRRSSTPTGRSTPVSSPLLRSMIPSQPISSSKPWNCLSQQAIDECRALISKAEQSWSPDCHLLFTPQDRKAVMELLRVGKRLEQRGTGLCVRDLWPLILSFCGRGWFEPQTALTEDNDEMQGLVVGGETGNSILNSLSIRSTLSTDDSMEEEDEQMADNDGGDNDDYLALPSLSN